MYILENGVIYFTENGLKVLHGPQTSIFLILGTSLIFKSMTFNLTNEQYELNDTATDSFNYEKDGVTVNATLSAGVHTVDTTSLTKVNINGSRYDLVSGSWVLHVPYEPQAATTEDNAGAIAALTALVHGLSEQITENQDSITTINGDLTAVNSDISDLQTESADHETRIAQLEGV